MKKLLVPTALLIATSLPSFLYADVEQTQVAEDKIKIAYKAEDTRSELGRKEIEKQIREAAEKVCGEQDLRRAGSLGQVSENRRCYAKAVESGMNALARAA